MTSGRSEVSEPRAAWLREAIPHAPGSIWPQRKSPDLGKQGASVADIFRSLPSLDRGEGWLQQSAGIVGRSGVAPEAGKIGRGTQFENASFLAAGDFDGLK